jgi:hypothetical protein
MYKRTFLPGIGLLLISSLAFAARGQAAPADDAPPVIDAKGRILVHHRMAGPTLPPEICDLNDARTTTLSCERQIDRTHRALMILSLPHATGMAPTTIVNDRARINSQKIKFEKRLADFERALRVLRARGSLAPPEKSGAIPDKFQYAFDPELGPPPSSCDLVPCNAAWNGDEAKVTVLPPNPPLPCSFTEWISEVSGSLVVPTIQPPTACDGVTAYSSATSWWVGLGGDQNVVGYDGHSDNDLYQVGIQGQIICPTNGSTQPSITYFVWQSYTGETADGSEVPIEQFDGYVHAGDIISLDFYTNGPSMIVNVTDNDTFNGAPPPPFNMTYPGSPDGAPLNTAEFITERLDKGSNRAYPIPIPSPVDQSAAFQSIQATGNSYYYHSGKKGPNYTIRQFGLNQNVGNQPACEDGLDYCGTPFIYTLTTTSCESETAVAIAGSAAESSGGYTYRQSKNPPAGSCPQG